MRSCVGFRAAALGGKKGAAADGFDSVPLGWKVKEFGRSFVRATPELLERGADRRTVKVLGVSV